MRWNLKKFSTENAHQVNATKRHGFAAFVAKYESTIEQADDELQGGGEHIELDRGLATSIGAKFNSARSFLTEIDKKLAIIARERTLPASSSSVLYEPYVWNPNFETYASGGDATFTFAKKARGTDTKYIEFLDEQERHITALKQKFTPLLGTLRKWAEKHSDAHKPTEVVPVDDVDAHAGVDPFLPDPISEPEVPDDDDGTWALGVENSPLRTAMMACAWI